MEHSAFTTGYIPIDNGSLYYEIAGTGKPLIFIHGYSLDRRMWEPQFELFSKSYQVICYDLRGFGKSSEQTQDEYAHHTDLKVLVDFLNIPKAHLIGLSLGGRVAIDFTLTYPEKVITMTTADTVIHGFNFKSESVYAQAVEAAIKEGPKAANEIWMKDPLFEYALKKPIVAAALKEIVSDYSGWHWTNNNPWIPIDPKAIEQLDRIKSPTLILVGEHDVKDFRDMADLLGVKVSNSLKFIVPGSGHMSNMENPDFFNTKVLNFLLKHS